MLALSHRHGGGVFCGLAACAQACECASVCVCKHMCSSWQASREEEEKSVNRQEDTKACNSRLISNNCLACSQGTKRWGGQGQEVVKGVLTATWATGIT